MPQITIPLIGQETRRGLGFSASSTKDQYFGGCVFTEMGSSETRSKNVYLEKRPGIGNGGTVSGGNIGTAILLSPSTARIITAYGGTNSTIFDQATSAGTITGQCWHITETLYNGVTYYLITSTDGTGWYLVNGAISDTSFTGDTHTNNVIDNLAGQSGLYVGQLITGSGIQAGTRIATRTPDTSTPTSITTTIVTTASASITITKEPIAKIINANFPVSVGSFAVMDGFAFVITATGKIYNSNLNDITTWAANNFIPADIATDQGVDVINTNNHIVAFGSTSVEYFYNAGNAAGSILSSRKELFRNVGVYAVAPASKVVCSINDKVYFIGNDFCLYTLEGLEPKKLSPQGIKLGTSSAAPSLISAFRLGTDTIVYIGCTDATADKFYSVMTNSWLEPNFGIAALIIANLSNAVGSQIAGAVSATNTSGILYSLDTSLYQDNSSAFTMTIQTEPKVLNKGKGFVINSIELLADNQSSGSTTLEISRDDYASFQTLGSFDLTQRRKRIYRGGLCRNHAIFRITDSGNNAWRGQALVVDYSPSPT